MIDKNQEKLIFLRIELDAAQKVVKQLRTQDPNIAADIKEWEQIYKDLTDRVFELEILQGVEV